MNTRLAGIIAISALMALSGCATMSGDECLTSDWRAIGYEDGSQGYSSNRLGERRKACAKHGVTPDFQVYQAGRTEGLKEYCQPQRGYNLGVGGGRYSGVCPSHLEPGFLDAYRTGAQLHTMRSNVNSANYQISAKERELDDLDGIVRAKEAELIASETTVQDRVLILADLKDLSERKGQLEAEIVGLIEDRVVYEQQLANYEQVLADSGY
jgi:hypothetical protein